jgi:hypothetical protein
LHRYDLEPQFKVGLTSRGIFQPSSIAVIQCVLIFRIFRTEMTDDLEKENEVSVIYALPVNGNKPATVGGLGTSVKVAGSVSV